MTLAFQRRQIPRTPDAVPSEHNSLTAERLERLRPQPAGVPASAAMPGEPAPWQALNARGVSINWRPIAMILLPGIVLAAAFGIWSIRGHGGPVPSLSAAVTPAAMPATAETSLPQDIAAMAAAPPVARGAAPAAVLKALADARPAPAAVAATASTAPDMTVAATALLDTEADALAALLARPAVSATVASANTPAMGVGGWVKVAAPPAAGPTAAPTQSSGWALAREPQAAPPPGVAAITKQVAPRPPAVAAVVPPAPAPRSPQAVIGWPATGPLTSFFGPSHPLGIDIGIPLGTPLLAAAAGRVSFTGGDPCCSYGYYIDLDHGSGVMTRYGHLIQPSFLRPGQFVRVGDVIGYSGSTGNSTGPHLHFEVRLNGWPVDPLLVLP